MSKIGKKPISIPEGVTVAIEGNTIQCTGPLGTVSISRLPFVSIKNGSKEITFTAEMGSLRARANWGTLRSLVASALHGVVAGFTKALVIEGVGYRAVAEGGNLMLYIGYSHPVRFEPPDGVAIAVEKNVIRVSGIDKGLVGQTAARIRAMKKPEPYKGKGIRYSDEVIRRKAGKKTASTAK